MLFGMNCVEEAQNNVVVSVSLGCEQLHSQPPTITVRSRCRDPSERGAL